MYTNFLGDLRTGCSLALSLEVRRLGGMVEKDGKFAKLRKGLIIVVGKGLCCFRNQLTELGHADAGLLSERMICQIQIRIPDAVRRVQVLIRRARIC